MKKKKQARAIAVPFARATLLGKGGMVALNFVLAAASPATALAFDFTPENPDFKARWDNTIKYSSAFRLDGPSSSLIDNSTTPGGNVDDGDRNFSGGLISNRLDLLSEMDLSYRKIGARASGAFWYDTVYHSDNDNDSPNSANSSSVPYNKFTKGTKELMGERAELLDGFVYGNFDIAGHPLTVRLGQHTVLYGESLYFGGNGVAGAQSPVDVIKAVAVPNSQFKEIIRPVPQISSQIQIVSGLTAGGYYQFNWRKNRILPAGSYFSFVDLLDEGGENLITATPSGPIYLLHRIEAERAKNSGQFGLQLKYRPEFMNGEFGLYMAQFHQKDPVVYAYFDTGEYNPVYPEDIKVYAASFSTAIDSLQLSSEVSMRTNMPLTPTGGTVSFFAPTTADNDDNPAYPVGKSAHAQVSAVYNMPRTPFWEGGFLLSEIAWNRALSVDKNPEALDPNATRDASALWLSIQPQYFQVLPGLDLTVPISGTYGLSGNSSTVNFSPAAPLHGGNVGIGVQGNYRNTWQLSVNYTHYYGPGGQVLNPDFSYSFKNVWKDRDFVSLSLQRTF